VIEVGRSDGRRGFVGEGRAVGVEAAFPLVQTDVVGGVLVGSIGDDN